jgi:hypothetical protein
MKDDDRARYPRPVYPEMEDLAREQGDVPIMKPVRYDAQSVDLRPASPKDMKDVNASAPVSESTPPPEIPASQPVPLERVSGTPAPAMRSNSTAASIRPEETTPAPPSKAPAPSLAPPDTLP